MNVLEAILVIRASGGSLLSSFLVTEYSGVVVDASFGFKHSWILVSSVNRATGISETGGKAAMGSGPASVKFVVCPLLVSVCSHASWAKRFGLRRSSLRNP
jgi:hypothetical protein